MSLALEADVSPLYHRPSSTEMFRCAQNTGKETWIRKQCINRTSKRHRETPDF